MRVALVHELLTMNGGAERVLKVLADTFPQAPIYTLLHNERIVQDLGLQERVMRSTLQRWAPLSTNHHLYLPFFPAAVEAWDFSGFDLVISSSSAFAHGIITNGHPKHLSYVHAPARYLWDRFHDVQMRTPTGLARRYHSWIAHRLRVWDAEAAQRPDAYLAASHNVARRIQLYWNRDAQVLHPPVGDEWFNVQASAIQEPAHPFFLIVSTLAPYKRIDYAIEACNHTGHRLIIAGNGPDRTRLQSLAGPTVTFCGRQEGAALAELYTSARAVIFPGLEDFGLVPLEAMACGTPIIAYRGGGVLETVTHGVTGMFFDEQTASSLAQTLQAFDHKKYSHDACRQQARKFGKDRFVQELYSHIDALMKSDR